MGENRRAFDARGLGEEHDVARAGAGGGDRTAPDQEPLHVAGHDRPGDPVRDLRVSSGHGDAQRPTGSVNVADDGHDL